MTFVGAAIVAWAALAQASTARRRHEEQTKADLERRITESFAKAVEQLGSENLTTCLSGIYTLERIVCESEWNYWPTMEILTAYLRKNAPSPLRQSDGAVDQEREPTLPGKRLRPAPEVQGIVWILRHRPEEVRTREILHLDLSATDLRGTDLSEAHLEGADLSEAHLEGADLSEAHLEGADLLEAHLEGAQLFGAHLDGATNLTPEQINSALGDENTLLPEGLKRPAHWTKR